MKQVLTLPLAVLMLGGMCSSRVAGLEPGSIAQPVFSETSQSPIGVGPMAGKPVIVDCNGDGKLDILLACGTCCGSRPHPESGHVIVLLGDGRGGFARAPGSPVLIASSARKIAVGDVNGDRKLDILVAQHDSYEVVILLGNGDGSFKPGPTSPVVAGSGRRAHTHDITVGDVNGDGHLDFLTTNASDNNISVLLGDGKGGFKHAAGSPVSAGRHPYDIVALRDVNGDGKLDLLSPNLAGNAVSVMLGDGAGGFSHSGGSPFGLGPRPGYIVVEDLNGDGKLDIAASHDDDPLVYVLLGDGKGGFVAAAGSPMKTETPVWGLSGGEINGDGKKDLVAVSPLGHNVALFLGDGKGGFVAARSLRAGTLPNYVAVGDLNGDGRPEIVVSNYGSGDVSVFLNEGARD